MVVVDFFRYFAAQNGPSGDLAELWRKRVEAAERARSPLSRFLFDARRNDLRELLLLVPQRGLNTLYPITIEGTERHTTLVIQAVVGACRWDLLLEMEARGADLNPPVTTDGVMYAAVSLALPNVFAHISLLRALARKCSMHHRGHSGRTAFELACSRVVGYQLSTSVLEELVKHAKPSREELHNVFAQCPDLSRANFLRALLRKVILAVDPPAPRESQCTALCVGGWQCQSVVFRTCPEARLLGVCKTHYDSHLRPRAVKRQVAPPEEPRKRPRVENELAPLAMLATLASEAGKA